MSNQSAWSDYWEKEGVRGEVFVTPSGKKNTQLANFWKRQFNTTSQFNTALDIASGAGSVFSSIEQVSIAIRIATDISCSALKAVKKNWSNVHTIQADAAKLPFADNSIELVLSQFGIEYAESATGNAFSEACRVLKSGGSFRSLCHYKGGEIETRANNEFGGLTLLDVLDFIPLCKIMAEALYSADSALIQEYSQAFKQAEKQLFDYCQKHSYGLHQHIYHGVKTLFSHLNQYGFNDIIRWLNDIEQQKKLSLTRLKLILDAAFDASDIKQIDEIFRDNHCKLLTSIPVVIRAQDSPVGWHICAVKET